MRPHESVVVYRTQNDTDPMSFIIEVQADAGTAPISDSDTVVLHIKASGNVSQITGTALGDSSGTFLFSPTLIKGHAEVMQFELKVTRVSDGALFTAATGTVVSTRQMS